MALSKEWYDAEFVDSESESLHRAPSIEYSFYNAVKTGDMEYVIKNCKEDAFIHLEGTGVLSRNTLQNIKYHFVVTTAMITRCLVLRTKNSHTNMRGNFYLADTQYTISNAINFINYHSMYISTV